MRRNFRYFFVLSMVLLLLSSTALGDVLGLTGAESKAFQSLNESNYIRARKESEDIIREEPDSFMGNYVLSGVFLHGEGNLLRGLQLHREALESFEREFCEDAEVPRTSELQKWHQRLLVELSEIYAELDDRDRQLKELEHVESLYKVNMDLQKIWALMKLERLEEARGLSEKYLNSSDYYSRTVAYNNMIAIEDSEYRYLASYEIAKAATRVVNDESCVILSNLTRAAVSLLRFSEAREAAVLASKAKERDCPADPNIHLLRFHIQAGEYQKAISVGKLLRSQPPTKRMRVQTEKDQRAAFADLFFSMAYVEKAYELMKTVVEAPDRQGYNSYSKEKYFLSSMVPYIFMLRVYINRLEERRSVFKALYQGFDSGFSFENLKLLFSELRRLDKGLRESRIQLWKAQQVILFHALNPATMRGILVPYHMIDNPSYQFAFMDSLGISTSEALLAYEEALITPAEREAILPNSRALRAYISWKRHDEDALSKLEQAIEGLPKEMQMLRLQLRLFRADILYREGETEAAYLIFHEILERFPAAFRMHEIALPVSFENLPKRLEKALLSSGRFVEDEESLFQVSFSEAEIPFICLSNRQGSRYQCSTQNEKDLVEYEKARDAKIADNFLHVVFTPRVDLTQSDIHSLDGSPIRIGADQALDELMN